MAGLSSEGKQVMAAGEYVLTEDEIRLQRDWWRAKARSQAITISHLEAKIEGYEAAIARMTSPSICDIPETAFPPAASPNERMDTAP